MRWNPPKWVVGMSFFGSFVGGIVAFKEYLGGGNYKGEEKLKGKTAIVTGANTGIGKETAKALAQRKATVIMACRDLKKCEEARMEIVLETLNKKVHCRECDLASLSSIRNFVKSVDQMCPRGVHLLINNAGVMRIPERTVTKDGFETQMGTNHFGHFLLTSLLLDKIKVAAPSRIINVSSVAHQKGEIDFGNLNWDTNYDPSAAYNRSKLANVLFTVELADRLKGTDVTCNAVHPGIINTEITRHMSFYNSWISQIFLKPFVWLFIKNSRQGAQTTVYAALNEDLVEATGKYFSNQCEAEPSAASQDRNVSKRLWAISERWTGLS